MSRWTLTYEGYKPEHEPLREALCTLGNGAFATRGAAPESSAGGPHYPGTYVAGCYDRLVTRIAGRDVENEDLVNVPNWLPLSFRPSGGEWFTLESPGLLEYRQELDLRTGTLVRHIRFRDAERTTRVTQRRIVSMDDPHLAAIETTFVPEDWSGEIEVRSALDGRVVNAGVARYRDLRGDHLSPQDARVERGIGVLETATTDSRVLIVEAARTRVVADTSPPDHRFDVEPGFVAQNLTLDVEQGREARVEKVVALVTSLDHAIYLPAPEAVSRASQAGTFDELHRRHVLAWDRLWRQFDLTLDGHDRPQQILRLHVFHLLQTASPHTVDRDVGVPARGLHGEAYRGHIFWDELFIFPFLNLRLPALTRSLLAYRFRRLPRAREAARRAGYAGAMYPWQSGSDGREESQQVHLNPRSGRWVPDHSHLQRHINLAIGYNVWKYFQASNDIEFLSGPGAEMLSEIARFWGSVASYNHSLDRYDIRGVMGPDEYHDGYPAAKDPGLDNNAYTNVMTAWLLRRTMDAFDVLSPHDRDALWERLDVRRDEIELWDDISRKLRVPFHDGVISQFEGYEDLAELDWEDYRARYGDIQRLDRILESEHDSTNNYKVSKQADALMLFYLLSDEELRTAFERLGYAFDPETDIRRNVDYYLARTSHGSTLSRVVHSWILSRLDPAHSWKLFCEALESDVADIQGGTTAEGIHLGAMAGTVDLAQRAFGGIQARADALWVSPVIPSEVKRLEATVSYRGQRVHVDVSDEHTLLSSEPGPAAPVQVRMNGDTFELTPGGVLERRGAEPTG